MTCKIYLYIYIPLGPVRPGSPRGPVVHQIYGVCTCINLKSVPV